MSYLVVENFNGGLDGRRHVLAAKPGTLAKLRNAHITRGGEVEKRKSFSQTHDFGGMTAFGLIAGKDTLFTFFSAGYGPNWRFDYNTTIPGVKVTAICLWHPFKNYYQVSLTRIVSGTLFGGKPLVIAEWSDGSRYPYYDGYIVSQSIGGVIPDGVTSILDIGGPGRESFLCYHVGRMINNGKYEGWEPFESRADGYLYVKSNGVMNQEMFYSQSSVVVNGSDPGVLLFGPVGKSYDVTISSKTDELGAQDYLAMYTQVLETATPTTPAKSGTATITFIKSSEYKFAITANCPDGTPYPLSGSAGYNSGTYPFATNSIVKEVSVNGSDLLAYDVTRTASQTLPQFFQSIADSINSLSGTHNFVATLDVAGTTINITENNLGKTTGTITVKLLVTNPVVGDMVMTVTGVGQTYIRAQNRYQTATWGFGSSETGGGITNLTANGTAIIPYTVNYHGSMPDFVQSLATIINAGTGSHGYTAIRNVNSLLVQKTGSSGNGHIIAVNIHGTMNVSATSTPIGGGTDAVVGRPQKTFIGFKNGVADLAAAKTAGLEMTISVTVEGDSQVYTFGSDRIAGIDPSILFTYQGKGYMTDGSVFYFSALNDVTRWDRQATGSGFIDASNNLGIRDDITGIGVYQGKVAVFTRNDVQVWFVDPDPALNRLVQSIGNTGCIAPKSVTSFGSIDVFYLSDSGLRSLRARDASDAAFMADVGHPIDNFILEQFKDLTDEEKSRAIGLIDPSDGRYWLCIDNKIYVYSYFPGSSIAAWSTYDLGITDEIEMMQVVNGRIFIKTIPNQNTNGKVYVYGGVNGHTYDDCLVEVELPYLDGSKPATYKSIKGIDATVEGEWVVYLGFDHTNPTARDKIATLTQSTFALGKIDATGMGTHIGPRIVSQSNGYARLANFIVHYDEMHSKHEAG